MRRQCCSCCCAIVVIFSIFTAFLKFNSIDAGCTGSREKPLERFPNRIEWHDYCRSIGQQFCNIYLFQPCIISARTGECEAPNLKAELDLTPNETWDKFCENIQPARCTETMISPCHWNTYTSGESECVAKGSARIFVEYTYGK
ncbi:hypothetical protein niasHT_025511 [Heterodera trifolii]|uniref:Uncharacterized protein n=1 Tax=Heterodera trifolii TaxID=157864 RepID=A0ABD2J8U4_9BILA